MAPLAEQQDRGHKYTVSMAQEIRREDTVGYHEKGYFRHSPDEILIRIIIRHWVRSQSLLMVFNSGKNEMKKGFKVSVFLANQLLRFGQMNL